MNESEHNHRKQQQQQQNYQQQPSSSNKPFNIDIATISAPMSLGSLQQIVGQSSLSDINKSQTLIVGVPPINSSSSSSSSSAAAVNSISLLSSTTMSKTNSLNSKRAFTAALTATANTIIGKHKQQIVSTMEESGGSEIRVTEDEDKIRRQQQQQQQFTQFSTHFEDDLVVGNIQLHSSDTTEGSERSSDDEHHHHHHRHTIQVASSQTSSTAVSNCSSTNLGPPYTPLYSPFDSTGLVNHPGTLVGVVNGTSTKLNGGFCSDSTGSNSDPIAINNSLSSNSTTDSPTYGYNLANGGQSHTKQQQSSSQQAKSREYHMESAYSTPSRPKKVVYEVIV